MKTHPAGRGTSDDREFWILQRAIDQIIAGRGVETWQLDKNESPDFILRIDELTIGVEVTEAIPQSLAQYMSMVSDVPYSPTVFWRNQSGAKKIEIQALADKSLRCEPIIGNEIERLLAQQLFNSHRIKADMLKSDKLTDLDENQLIIYDRGSPAGTMLSEAISMVVERTDHEAVFNVVWVVSDSKCQLLYKKY